MGNWGTNRFISKEIIKNVFFSLIIYLIGYMHWSIAWLIIPVLLNSISVSRKRQIDTRRDFVRAAAEGREKEVILENIADLPAWVYFPDVERAEWLNKIIKQFWPSLNFYAKDIIHVYLEQKLRKNLEKYTLKGFSFERIILGSVPFRTGGIIVYDNTARDEVVMDVDIAYAGDCDIKFRLRGLIGGLKNFQMYGKLRIVLKPLIKSFPLIGGVHLFFLNNPDVEFELDGIAGILEIPGINESLIKCFKDTISSLMVLPNKFPIKLSKEVDAERLNTPNPAGVLRVHVLEARYLEKKTLPLQFIILEHHGQELAITVWDEDQTEDEFLGRTSLDISNLINEGQSDVWLPLENVKHGDIHIRCTWLILTRNYSDLKAALYESRQLEVAYMSSALLIVFIDSATNLRQVKSSTKPDPYVQLQLGKQCKHTNVIMRNVNPVWEESFLFLVSDPDSDFLNVKINDLKTESVLAEINYNISYLTVKDDLEVVKEPLRFDSGDGEGKLVWSLHLKIFKNNNFREFLDKKSTLVDKCSFEFQESSSSSDEANSSNDASDKTSRSSSTKSSRNSPEKLKLSKKSQHFSGNVRLTMRYSLQRQRLIVVLHSIHDLHYEDPNATKDIYVKLYLLPDRNKASKRKTQIVKDCQSPTFDKKFEFLVTQSELNSKKLEISVMEEKTLRNEMLGQAVINIRKLNLPHSGYFSLNPHE